MKESYNKEDQTNIIKELTAPTAKRVTGRYLRVAPSATTLRIPSAAVTVGAVTGVSGQMEDARRVARSLVPMADDVEKSNEAEVGQA